MSKKMLPKFRRLSMPDYLGIKKLSSSICRDLFLRTPREARHESFMNPEYINEPWNSADLGTLAHAYVLGDGIDDVRVLDYDDWRKNEAKEKRAELRDQRLTAVLKHQVIDAEAMKREAHIFMAESEFADMFFTGKPELVLEFEIEGIPCKMRPDMMAADGSVLMHFKTTKASVKPRDFNRMIPSMGYDISEEFYRRGAIAAGLPDARHIFFVQSQEAPFLCSLVEMGNSRRALAVDKLNRSIRLWGDNVAAEMAAIAEGKAYRWPGHPAKAVKVDAQDWELHAAELAD